jgi:hypothetical protein
MRITTVTTATGRPSSVRAWDPPLAALFVFMVATSCRSERAAAPEVLPALHSAVVGNAAASLDSTGHFVLDGSSRTAFEIDEAKARELAEGWVTTFAHFFRGFLERQRRAPINVESLKPCGRTYYAQSPFVIRTDAAPLPILRPYAAWWIVTLCAAGGEPQVSLAISSLTQQARVEGGQLYLPPPNGNEFVSLGIPPGLGELVIAPEDAVRELAAVSGRRTAATPRLVLRAPGTVPQLAQWELTLDTIVPNETAHGRQEAQTFYVSRGLRLDSPEAKQGLFVISVPQPGEPVEVTARYPEYDDAGRLVGWKSAQIARDGTPSVFIPTVLLRSRAP